MDGDIERRQTLLLDAKEFRLFEVGQRDVVAVQEGKPEVVVLDVQALAHAARQLMDEAEYALVGAGRDFRWPRRFELESHSRPAAQQHRVTRSSVPLHDQLEPLVARMEMEVDRVAKPGPVDTEDTVPRPEPRAGRRALAADRAD